MHECIGCKHWCMNLSPVFGCNFQLFDGIPLLFGLKESAHWTVPTVPSLHWFDSKGSTTFSHGNRSRFSTQALQNWWKKQDIHQETQVCHLAAFLRLVRRLGELSSPSFLHPRNITVWLEHLGTWPFFPHHPHNERWWVCFWKGSHCRNHDWLVWSKPNSSILFWFLRVVGLFKGSITPSFCAKFGGLFQMFIIVLVL